MDTIKKIIAKTTFYRCLGTSSFKGKSEDFIAQIDNFDTLDDYFEYLVIVQNAPLQCLPYNYLQFTNTQYLRKLVNKKPSLINDIYDLNYYVYRQILRELDLKKFLKHCKFALCPQIKQDIHDMLGETVDDNDFLDIIPKSTASKKS